MVLRKLLARFRSRFRRDLLKHKVKCDRSARLRHPTRISLGRYIYIGPGCDLNAQGGITIGDGTILAPEVVILSSSHDYNESELLPYDGYDVHRPVTVGKGVWIGYRAMICPGVSVGDGAVVAMGAVVTRNVSAGQVVGGNPAKPIGQRDSAAIAGMIDAEDYFHYRHWSGPRPREEASRR